MGVPTKLVALLLLATVSVYMFFRNKKTITDVRPKKKKSVAIRKIDLFIESMKKKFPSLSEEQITALFPRKFEVHGHVVVVRLNNSEERGASFVPYAELFAASFAPIKIDVVLVDDKGIAGELRQPAELVTAFENPVETVKYLKDAKKGVLKRYNEMKKCGKTPVYAWPEVERILDGHLQSSTFTVHIENGIRYSFDVRRVMFSSGNTTERMHFAVVDARNETVVDMFSGIGYFTIPLAVHGGPSVIHALEKNPDSVEFIQINAVQNGVGDIVRPQCGDNREVGDELRGTCDRVLMGYIPSCKEFLARAVSFLKHDDEDTPRGVVHYHFLADRHEGSEVAMQHLTEELGEFVVAKAKITDIRCVKSYAPKRYHFVADVSFLTFFFCVVFFFLFV
ncbi:tRNA wybutosine-synthesizing protein 2 [Angomonas deanei]|nr:tRNA wybutosine-synthesizing protein 2 [Angomonas deanei]|eukprot:EPY37326.1 tRNA wybutosine-synthesizing protein 2 [Angomonas deanei]